MSFKYEYTFIHENENVVVVVDFEFTTVADVEDISQFSHRQRRALGRHILTNTTADCFHSHALLNIQNAFTRQLGKIFGGSFWFYWTRRFKDTLIYITGF